MTAKIKIRQYVFFTENLIMQILSVLQYTAELLALLTLDHCSESCWKWDSLQTKML